ncbi:MAG: energy transducer TonB [Bacteroidales bacterium]|nr:energy transducer TonB [Lentimicrobiaceae bacterium]MDD5695014.1 energy transducer TonB [Bacteroidales bacterium]
MVVNKSPKADLEGKRGILIQTGLIIALALTLMALEWKQHERKEIVFLSRENIGIIDEVVIQTGHKEQPSLPSLPEQTSILQRVGDRDIVDDDVRVNAEIDENIPMDENGGSGVEMGTGVAEEGINEDEVFMVVEESPSFPGGDAARMLYLQKNIQYPPEARKNNIQGTVYIIFVVESNGYISGVKVLKGIGGGCDEEAIRVVKKMPTWNPGKQRGKPVRVLINMPIRFAL